MNDELPFETWNYEEQTRMKHLVFLYRVTDEEIIRNVQDIQNDISTLGAALEFKGEYNASTNTPDLDTSPVGVEQGQEIIVPGIPAYLGNVPFVD